MPASCPVHERLRGQKPKLSNEGIIMIQKKSGGEIIDWGKSQQGSFSDFRKSGIRRNDWREKYKRLKKTNPKAAKRIRNKMRKKYGKL
jgi:hypothetical protein